MAEKKKKKKKKLLIAGVVTPVMLAIFGIATVVLLPKILWDKAWGAVMDAIEAIIDTGKGVAQWLGDPNQPDREQLALMRFKDADGFDDLYSFDFLFALDQDDDSENPYAGLKNKISAAFSKMYLSESDMVTLLDALYDPATTKADADYVSTHFLYKPQIRLELTAEEFATIYEQAFEVLAHSPITDELIADYRAYKATGSKMTEDKVRTTAIVRDTNMDGRFSGEDTIRYIHEDLETLSKSREYSSFGYVPEYVDEKGNPINQQYELRLQLLNVCEWTTELRDPENGSIKRENLQLLASWWRHFGVIFHYSPVASYINGKLEEKAKEKTEDNKGKNKDDKSNISYIGEETLIEKQSRAFSIIMEPYGDYSDANISFIYELDRVRYPGMNEKYVPEQNPILFQEGSKTGTYTIDAFLMENGKVKSFSTVSYEDETRKFGVDWQMMYAALVLYGRGNEPTGTDKEELEKQIKAIQEQQEGVAEVDKDSGTLKIKKSVIRAMAKTFKNMEELEKNDVTSIEAINDYLKENELYRYADINQKSLAHQGWVKWNDAADLTHENRYEELFEGVTSNAYVPTYIPRTYKSALCDVTYASYEGGSTINQYTITYHWDTFANELKKKGIDLNDEKIWEEYKKVLEELPGGDRIIAKLEHVKEFSGTEFQEDMAYSVTFGNYERVGGVYATVDLTLGAENSLPYPNNGMGSTCNDDSPDSKEANKGHDPENFRSSCLSEEDIDLLLEKICDQFPNSFPNVKNGDEATIGYTLVKTALNAVGRITYNQYDRSGAPGDNVKPFSNRNLKYSGPLYQEANESIFRGVLGLNHSGFYDNPIREKTFANYDDTIVLSYGLFGSIYTQNAWPLSALFPQARYCNYSTYSKVIDDNGGEVGQIYPYTADCSSFVDILYTAALVSIIGDNSGSYLNAFGKDQTSDLKATGNLKNSNDFSWKAKLDDGSSVSILYEAYAIDLRENLTWQQALDLGLCPGDILIRQPKGHALLFLGWTLYNYPTGPAWRPLCVEMRGAGGAQIGEAYGACALSVLGAIDGNRWYRGHIKIMYDDLSHNPLEALGLKVTELPNSDVIINSIEAGVYDYDY